MSFQNTATSYRVLAASASAAEKAYLWCLLTDGVNLDRKDIRVVQDDFFTPEHWIVFQAIKDIYDEGGHPDLIQVSQKIADKWHSKQIGNQMLSDLITWDFGYASFRKYEMMIKDNSRKIAAQKVVDKVMGDTERSASQLLAYWQELIAIATNWAGNATRWFDIKHAHNLADKISELDGKDLFGYSFWHEFKFLDRATKWIQKGKTYRIGAPSNTGKSQFAYSVINNLLAQGAKVMFLTLENEVETTLGYLMSNHQAQSMDSILRWDVQGDFDYLTKISWQLSIIDSAFYLSDIFSRCMEFNPDVVILDYIGLMSIKGFTEEAKYTEYAIQVQRFVKQTQMSWIDLSNLPTNLQASEDIRWNPQFFWSTFLRNNTDVGIHITPWKEFYEVREKVLNDALYSDEEFAHWDRPPSWFRDKKEEIKRMSWVTFHLSKNRLWPHSISTNYMIDFTKWAKFRETTQAEFTSLKSNFWLW